MKLKQSHIKNLVEAYYEIYENHRAFNLIKPIPFPHITDDKVKMPRALKQLATKVSWQDALKIIRQKARITRGSYDWQGVENHI